MEVQDGSKTSEMFDEAGDLRLMTENQRLRLLKAIEELKIKHQPEFTKAFKDMLIYGTCEIRIEDEDSKQCNKRD